MAISEKNLQRIKRYLDESKKPIFFFDDDPDGLSSFLLFYRYVKRGKGVIVKSSPMLKEEYAIKANEYYADTVFVLDKPLTTQEFVDGCVSNNIVILDHHPVIKLKGVHYFNPRISNSSDNRPTSYWAYRVVNQDLWIAMTGIIGDWYIPPDLIDKFRKLYPELVPKKYKDPGDMLFESPLGRLSRIFSFVLKGRSQEVMKAIKILTRITSPSEIMNQETARGRFIYKKFEKVESEYEKLLSSAMKHVQDKHFIVFTYPGRKTSFTGELSNELLHRFPDKINIIGREKSGFVRCSIRSKDISIPPILKKALVGIRGYGGGHDHACGASIKVDDFNKFVEQFKLAVNEQLVEK